MAKKYNAVRKTKEVKAHNVLTHAKQAKSRLQKDSLARSCSSMYVSLVRSRASHKPKTTCSIKTLLTALY